MTKSFKKYNIHRIKKMRLIVMINDYTVYKYLHRINITIIISVQITDLSPLFIATKNKIICLRINKRTLSNRNANTNLNTD